MITSRAGQGRLFLECRLLHHTWLTTDGLQRLTISRCYVDLSNACVDKKCMLRKWAQLLGQQKSERHRIILLGALLYHPRNLRAVCVLGRYVTRVYPPVIHRNCKRGGRPFSTNNTHLKDAHRFLSVTASGFGSQGGCPDGSCQGKPGGRSSPCQPHTRKEVCCLLRVARWYRRLRVFCLQ